MCLKSIRIYLSWLSEVMTEHAFELVTEQYEFSPALMSLAGVGIAPKNG